MNDHTALVFDFLDLACCDCQTIFTGCVLPGCDFDTSPCPSCGSTTTVWEPWNFDFDFDHDFRVPGYRIELPHSVRVFPYLPFVKLAHYG